MSVMGFESMTPLPRTPSAPPMFGGGRLGSAAKFHSMNNSTGLIDVSHAKNIYNPARY